MVPFRRVLCNARRVIANGRPMSASAGPLVNVSVDDNEIATVTLQRAPVNSLNLELLQEMKTAFDDLTKNKARGMILTSASPTVFSAGLDIMEMYKPDLKRVETFWSSLQDVWLKLYGSAYPTVAAINGHAPAGGCLLAMSCEYRVMVAGKFQIGLNETALGIVAPTWFQDTMKNTISARDTELALTTAKMFSVEEALKAGLIDETATDKADAIAKANKFLARFQQIPPKARSMTKQIYREAAITRLAKHRDADLQQFIGLVKLPQTQQNLELYISMLKGKSKK